ncbi:MAG: type II toxin-antitoxin system RelE/ParE family toxin [Pirellulales bacterium]|nr:type II toxin-antitoxin system RelE/ParE family toxin [Pirellulales bacterium]
MQLKPIEWIGSSRSDLAAFPQPVRREFGHALYMAQAGEKSPLAKPLRGFGGAGVLEIVESFNGNAYRVVYTVKFVKAVFVLHSFQKKSKRGMATPQAEIDLIVKRLRDARTRYQEVFGAE